MPLFIHCFQFLYTKKLLLCSLMFCCGKRCILRNATSRLLFPLSKPYKVMCICTIGIAPNKSPYPEAYSCESVLNEFTNT